MKRSLGIAALILLIVGLGVTICDHLGYRFSIQSSDSMPHGLYLISPAHLIQRGDVVVFKPDMAVQQFLRKHRFAPQSGLLMKRVFALSGDFVCKKIDQVWINGHPIAPVYREYAPHKKLPSRPFCGILKSDQYLLMSTRVPRSFDGRYFGAIAHSAILGKAHRIIRMD